MRYEGKKLVVLIVFIPLLAGVLLVRVSGTFMLGYGLVHFTGPADAAYNVCKLRCFRYLRVCGEA